MLADYLSKELVKVTDKVSSIDEAIGLSGGLLEKCGYTTSEYTDSMKATYEQFGPYMVLVDGVALFHGKPNVGVNKAGLSLVILKEKFQVPNSEKSIKLCFSFSSLDNDGHMNMIQAFAGLLMDTERLNELLVVDNKESALNIIRNEKENQ